MKNIVKAAGLLAALGLLAVLAPSPAQAEKSIGEQCIDRGGTWVGSPIGSMSKGYCILALTAGGTVSRDARCKAAGGTPEGAKCKLNAAAFSKFVRQTPR